jgi:hypothetical protein
MSAGTNAVRLVQLVIDGLRCRGECRSERLDEGIAVQVGDIVGHMEWKYCVLDVFAYR